MTVLLAADRCPGCGHVHGTHPEWPSCPAHGHYLHQYRAGPEGFTYACPARHPRPCTYTHTQTERATMTDSAAALAIREGQDFWTPKQAAALAQLFEEMPPNADLAVFLHRCQVTGLDPFGNQITMIKRGGRWKIQTEIDGFRVIAARAARRDDVRLSYGKTFWIDHARVKYDSWFGPEEPAACELTVYVDDRPIHAQIAFREFAVVNRNGDLAQQWRDKPGHMIGKCAEAQVLRKAFPLDLEGMVVAEEAGQYKQPRAAPMPRDIVASDPDAIPPNRIREPEPVDAQTLKDAIAGEFSRLGIDDEEERAVYGYQLAGVPHGTELTPEDLDRALSALVDCETIEHIREITGQNTLEGP